MKLTTLLAFTLFSFSYVIAAPDANGVSIHEMPLALNHSTKSLQPILESVKDKKIILLGESIHLASEFSIARAQLIKSLHAEKGLKSVYFEGSPIEFWIAEDIFLSSARTRAEAIEFQKTAMFALWQTKEIVDLIQYALNSQTKNTENWLYLSSYDVQIGQGMNFVRGRPLFPELVSRLLSRGVALTSELQDATAELEGLALCKRKGFPATDQDYQKAKATILELDKAIKASWTETTNPHLQMLAFLPKTLGFSLDFCRDAKTSEENYTQVRDSWSAKQFDYMNYVLPSRTVAWAHSGHTISTPRSATLKNFGYFLKKLRPTELYSIHFTAISGSALSFTDDEGNEVEPAEREILSAEALTFEAKLRSFSDKDFYMQLGADQATFSRNETTRMETSHKMLISPLESFDAYYVIQKLHPPKLFEY